MANAWCINAISCDWCLIQTLQNLDSSNIWVWVQFTAPDPLDDKRLDYIKYTDKCWNVCCLTNENEILIYATQWVIKNFTLTNDDANEVVNVKRNDIFWSNWKKTVVRYKTWSFPTSITDWTLAVEETTMNQYSSTWYNVSWLSDWTTYYFSAFAVAQDDTIIDMQSKQITTDFFWWKYQKVEYIQSNASWLEQNSSWQYIDTLFTPTPNTKVSIDIQLTTTSLSQQRLLWVYTQNSSYMTLNIYQDGSVKRSRCMNNGDWNRQSSGVYADTNRHLFELDNSTFKIYTSWTLIHSSQNSATSTKNWQHSLVLLALYSTPNSKVWRHCSAKMYSCKIRDNWTLIRDFIPAYRKSDSVIWLVDAVNKVFYTNAWSWTFTKWPDVQQ